MKEIKKKYASITIETIGLFKSYCVECQKKRKRKFKGKVKQTLLKA